MLRASYLSLALLASVATSQNVLPPGTELRPVSVLIADPTVDLDEWVVPLLCSEIERTTIDAFGSSAFADAWDVSPTFALAEAKVQGLAIAWIDSISGEPMEFDATLAGVASARLSLIDEVAAGGAQTGTVGIVSGLEATGNGDGEVVVSARVGGDTRWWQGEIYLPPFELHGGDESRGLTLNEPVTIDFGDPEGVYDASEGPEGNQNPNGTNDLADFQNYEGTASEVQVVVETYSQSIARADGMIYPTAIPLWDNGHATASAQSSIAFFLNGTRVVLDDITVEVRTSAGH